MLLVINAFKKRYKLEALVVLANAGLLSNQNIGLWSKEDTNILGARIKAESAIVKQKIAALLLKNGQSALINKDNGTVLIVSYYEARNKKDADNRRGGQQSMKNKSKRESLRKASTILATINFCR